MYNSYILIKWQLLIFKIITLTVVFFIHMCMLFADTMAQAKWREAGVRMAIQAGSQREYFHLYKPLLTSLAVGVQAASGWGVTPASSL